MKNFFIFTQGRTGSTAIVDELNKHPDIRCLQELFISRVNAPELLKAKEEYGESFMNHVSNPYAVLPYEVYAWQSHKVLSFPFDIYRREGHLMTKKSLMREYLDLVDAYGQEVGVSTLGLKALGNQVAAHPGLMDQLKNRGYRALYLERQNVVQKVLSGVVAHKRGVYNRKNFSVPDDSYEIDLDDFSMRVNVTIQEVAQEKALLKQKGFSVLEVSYEDFVADREVFFAPVFEFLEVEYALPNQSDYSKMINKPIHEVVENYTEFADKVHDLGMGDMLA